MARFRNLQVGDPAPWFRQRSAAQPSYTFDTAAGRYIVLAFFASAVEARTRAALAALASAGDVFDDVHASFFGVSNDPADEARLSERYPGYRYFLDFDAVVALLYGAKAEDGDVFRRLWFVLDPALRIVRVAPFDSVAAEEIVAFVRGLPPPGRHGGAEAMAPVLQLANVFEPELCRQLIDLYETEGGEDSGFMREVNGKTVLVTDAAHKRRRDCIVSDGKLIAALQERVRRRIVPEIAKVHQFQATRMERYLIGCYTAEDGGHFRPHRDNTTKGTAHRRFAVSINLNAEFEGGELCFPEYGPRTFKPAPGAAVVFSCSLLHAVTKVTRGRRYAFLPFLYDDAAAELRERNNQFLDAGVGAYRKD
ncbi:MAG TPA: 2OG-Fe(II) oxygenase [Vitreimonas sp.]|uniref:2OG-Fe(II) oxygenase n=1 Tax=Vitreimonas sp. TaxID=3069702 RepID=UPI002D5976B3|nr:2OG-Fe(II) oxygenase [Vitreimonas sp.]HYD87551.1 2OG-Fe(II) oxygenase [Vitreimonas sp.]